MIGYWLMNPNGVRRSNFVVPYSTSLESSNAMHLFSLTNLLFSSYVFLDTADDGDPAQCYRPFIQRAGGRASINRLRSDRPARIGGYELFFSSRKAAAEWSSASDSEGVI